MKKKRPVGRPVGMKMSLESRMKTSKSKLGIKHNQETIDKIKESVLRYWREGDGVSVRVTPVPES